MSDFIFFDTEINLPRSDSSIKPDMINLSPAQNRVTPVRLEESNLEGRTRSISFPEKKLLTDRMEVKDPIPPEED